MHRKPGNEGEEEKRGRLYLREKDCSGIYQEMDRATIQKEQHTTKTAT